ncbi:hypothetical protein M514_22905 [Trichuris suis]|uniref:Uncharacterized protein n=1 Tax=Trichuris suis TaxID=68888 RepID=A0A085N5Y1_9BILA|nr:hypothetical protein M514_22905 [Trichuris suis]
MTRCAEMKRNFAAIQQEKNYLESKLRKEEDEYASILSELQQYSITSKCPFACKKKIAHSFFHGTTTLQANSREQQLLQAIETMNRGTNWRWTKPFRAASPRSWCLSKKFKI